MPADTISGREVSQGKKQDSGWGTYDIGRLVGLVIGLEVNIIYYARYRFGVFFLVFVSPSQLSERLHTTGSGLLGFQKVCQLCVWPFFLLDKNR